MLKSIDTNTNIIVAKGNSIVASGNFIIGIYFLPDYCGFPVGGGLHDIAALVYKT